LLKPETSGGHRTLDLAAFFAARVPERMKFMQRGIIFPIEFVQRIHGGDPGAEYSAHQQ
jgi:hypothetical protein